MVPICNTIRDLRKRFRISQINLASASNIRNDILSKIENGWIPATTSYLKKLVTGFKSFGVDAHYLDSLIISKVKGERK